MAKFLDDSGLGYVWGKIKAYVLASALPLAATDHIPANADLNDYTTPGHYYSTSAAVSASLSNTPVTANSFDLIVIKMAKSTANSYIRIQIIFQNSTSGWVRYRIKNSNGNWQAWTTLAKGEFTVAKGVPADAVFTDTVTNFKLVTYTYAYSSISSGGSLNVTATDLGMSTPSGYTPIAAQQVSSGNGNVIARTWNAAATESTVAVALRNVATTAQSGTVTFVVLYASTSSIVT